MAQAYTTRRWNKFRNDEALYIKTFFGSSFKTHSTLDDYLYGGGSNNDKKDIIARCESKSTFLLYTNRVMSSISDSAVILPCLEYLTNVKGLKKKVTRRASSLSFSLRCMLRFMWVCSSIVVNLVHISVHTAQRVNVYISDSFMCVCVHIPTPPPLNQPPPQLPTINSLFFIRAKN